MAKAVRENDGLVLQYIGDEVEAVFGAPVENRRSSEKGGRGRFGHEKKAGRTQCKMGERGGRTHAHGTGIHTGEALAGNIGSPERLAYSLMGDTVNLAARLQELTKEFHCDILISEETQKRP